MTQARVASHRKKVKMDRKNTLVTLLIGCLCFGTPAFAKKDQPAEKSHDGLVLIEDTKADMVYMRPGADLSIYNKIMLMEPHISFKKNWQLDQNRQAFNRVTDRDIARIIARGKDLFTHVFTDELEAGGYQVVGEPGEDVLLVRPLIIDLDITAPDTHSANRVRTYTSSAGEATLLVELFDSVTGQILVRASDRKVDRDKDMRWAMPSSSISNRRDATRALRHWAEQLVDGLDLAKKNKNP